MSSLEGKVVVVAGATGGIGSAIVKELDKEGAVCILISKNEEKLKSLLGDLSNKKHKFYSADFTDRSSFGKVAKKIESDFEKINVLINAAGLGIYKAIEDVTFEDWETSFAVGVTAPYFLTKHLLPLIEAFKKTPDFQSGDELNAYMSSSIRRGNRGLQSAEDVIKKSKGSLVLNIGSGAGVIPMAGRSVYNTQKFALRGLTLSLAEEFKRTGTSFCLVNLGSVLTEFGPMTVEEKRREMESGKAYFTPEWVAKKIIEIVKEEKRDIEYTFYPSKYVGGSWKRSEEI